jgi:hypothetical protein
MMTTNDPVNAGSTVGDASRGTFAPMVTLMLLSPVLAEVHFGAIRFTVIFALLPAIGAWGCAAVLIREIVRRSGLDWSAIFLWGVALGLAEECLIQQTSFYPLVGLDPDSIYGRSYGVNWVYFLWAIGYESVWAVVIPIYLTEIAFPEVRRAPWLRRKGTLFCLVFFAIASFMAWFLWTQIMIPQLFPKSNISVPVGHFVAAASAIGVVIGLATMRRSSLRLSIRIPNPIVCGIMSTIVSLGWFVIVFLAYGVAPGIPVALPVAVGVVLLFVSSPVASGLSGSGFWNELHALAAVFGALTASMSAGYFILIGAAAPPIDYIGKAIVNVVTMGWMVVLMMRQLSDTRCGHHGNSSSDVPGI